MVPGALYTRMVLFLTYGACLVFLGSLDLGGAFSTGRQVSIISAFL